MTRHLFIALLQELIKKARGAMDLMIHLQKVVSRLSELNNPQKVIFFMVWGLLHLHRSLKSIFSISFFVKSSNKVQTSATLNSLAAF